MGLLEDVQSALPLLRAEAESLMLAECVTHRPGEPFTDADGVVVTPLVEVYAGKCKVQTTVAKAATPIAGGHVFLVENLQLHFPFDVSVGTGDVATITKAPDILTGLPDPDVLGKVFRLVELARGTIRTAKRWNVELVTA